MKISGNCSTKCAQIQRTDIAMAQFYGIDQNVYQFSLVPKLRLGTFLAEKASLFLLQTPYST